MRSRPPAAVRHAAGGLCPPGQPRGRRLHGQRECAARHASRRPMVCSLLAAAPRDRRWPCPQALHAGEAVDLVVRPEDVVLDGRGQGLARRTSPTARFSAISANTTSGSQSARALRAQTHPEAVSESGTRSGSRSTPSRSACFALHDRARRMQEPQEESHDRADACRGRRARVASHCCRQRAQADLAAAKAEGKVVWYTSTPVETAQQDRQDFRGADRHPGRAVPLRRSAHPAPLPAGAAGRPRRRRT